MKPNIVLRFLFTTLFIALLCGCAKPQYNSPSHYQLTKPEALNMNQALQEISGICFKAGDDGTMYAVEDEHGRIYTVNLDAPDKITDVKFGSKGDYEDLVFTKNSFYVLNSIGSISRVTFDNNAQEIVSVNAFDNILPDGEYEGLASLGDTLYGLCKHCKGVSGKSSLRIYKMAINDSGALTMAGFIEPSLSVVGKKGKPEKIFPSAMAYNAMDKQWFVLSGVNKLIIVMNDAFEMKDYFSLDPAIYEQPEGITFNSKGDLFISNEGHIGQPNILRIERHN